MPMKVFPLSVSPDVKYLHNVFDVHILYLHLMLVVKLGGWVPQDDETMRLQYDW